MTDKLKLPVVYHVTLTKNVKAICKQGLQRFKTSNWVQAGNKERYGNGEVFAFEHALDAIRWAGRMDWEFHQATGTGKVSLLTIEAPENEWSVDDADPFGQARSTGRWLKSERAIPPVAITDSKRVTMELIRTAVLR